jgi:geranylgeranyl pyrophosphate synthase
MVTFIEAMETANEAKRQELMDEILAYNQEDLEATCAVLEQSGQHLSLRKSLVDRALCHIEKGPTNQTQQNET